jgi:hypothetical protein
LIHNKSGEKLNPDTVLADPVPVYNTVSKYSLGAAAALPTASLGKFLVVNAPNPAGGAYAQARWPKLTWNTTDALPPD